ncbi:MAG: class I SAM-dependent methyltransferase [Chloroflexota bacterium]|nr:class I SAM-dependent methyltransferase [Chloroflexota bacterium]
MNDTVQTWHYGLVARHWAENNATGPEIAYFQQQIEKYGQPALDAGCGTGRLLIPFLRAGLDVDGCDVSGDMLAYCQQAAEREGLSPRLYQQALHNLDLPRRYQTIVACGVFGIGVSREQDFTALQRFHHHLLPGGMLIFETDLPYEDAQVWSLWRKEARLHLPEPWSEDIGKIPADGHEYELHYRRVAFDPLEQRITGEMRTLLFKDNQVVTDDTYTLTSNYYFRNEMRLLLEKAGFTVEAEKGDWTDTDATSDHDGIVYFARK